MLEYGFAVITKKSIHSQIVVKLIEEGYVSGTVTLFNVYDFEKNSTDKLTNLCLKRKTNINLKAKETHDLITVLFVKGINVVNKLKQYAEESNDLDNIPNVYVSNTQDEAIEDFCMYVGIDDFSKVEPILFENVEQPFIACNFNNLAKVKSKN